MLMSLVFFVTKNVKKIRKNTAKKSSYLLNDLSNFNEIFRNDVNHDNIKTPLENGIHPISEKYIFRKTTKVSK